MEDEQHPEQTPSLDPQSVEIARLLKQVQEHQAEIAQRKNKTVQLEKKTAKLEEELAQALKKTSRAGGRNQDEATLTQGSPQQNPPPPPQKQRRGSVVENLAGE